MRFTALGLFLVLAGMVSAAPDAPALVDETAWKDRFDVVAMVRGGRVVRIPPNGYPDIDQDVLHAGNFGHVYSTPQGTTTGDFVLGFLDPAPATRIDSVIFRGDGSSSQAREIEVLTSSAPDGADEVSRGRFVLPMQAGDYMVRVPPSEARSIILRVLSNHGGANLTMGRIRVLEVTDAPGLAITCGAVAPVPPSADLQFDLAAAAAGGQVTGSPEAGDDLAPLIQSTDRNWDSTVDGRGTELVFHLAKTATVPTIDGLLLESKRSYSDSYWVAVVRLEVSTSTPDRDFQPIGTYLFPHEGGRFHLKLPPTQARYLRLTPLVTWGQETRFSMGRVRVLECDREPRASDELAAAPLEWSEPWGRHDLLCPANGGKVVSFEPSTSEVELQGAQNLLKIRDLNGGWSTGAANQAVLALAAPSPIETLAFIPFQDPLGLAVGCAAPGDRARGVQVEWALSPDGPWTDLGPILLRPTLDRQGRQFTPFTASHLRVKLCDNSGGARFTLGRLQAYGPEAGADPAARYERDLLPLENGGNLVRTSNNQTYVWHLTTPQDESAYRADVTPDNPAQLTWAFRAWRVALLGELVVQTPKNTTWYEFPARIQLEATTGEVLSPYRTVGTLAIPPGEPGTYRLALGGLEARHVRVSLYPAESKSTSIALARLRLLEAEGPSILQGDHRPDEPRSELPGSPEGPLTEREDNGDPSRSQLLTWETTATARIDPPEDVDCFAYDHARPEEFQLNVRQEPFPRLEIQVVDPAGSLVRKVTPGELTESGGVVPLPAVAGRWTLRVSRPASAVLAIFDTSFSMQPAIGSIKDAAAAFLAAATGKEEMATAVFPPEQGPLSWLGGFTTDTQSLVAPTLAGLETRSNSDVPAAITHALEKLGERPSNRALVVLSDFDPSPCSSVSDVWTMIEKTGTRIDTLGFAVNLYDEFKRDCYLNTPLNVMQNLARATGGAFRYAPRAEDIPAVYQDVARSLAVTPPYSLMVGPRPGPGRLVVRFDSPATAKRVKPARTLMVVLDCSGSMNESLGAERKIDVAKRILIEMVRNLPAGAPVGLRVYGRRLHHKDPQTCQDRELVIPPGPLDPDTFVRSVESLSARGETPLVGSIVDAAADIPPGGGERAIMAVTDGLETCGGTEADLAGLLGSGTDFVKVNVVGFGLGDPAERQRLESLVAACRGSYFDARDAAALAAAVEALASSRWTAVAAGGSTVAEGTLSGGGAELASGEYRVRIDCSPPLEATVKVTARKVSEVVVAQDAWGQPVLSTAGPK